MKYNSIFGTHEFIIIIPDLTEICENLTKGICDDIDGDYKDISKLYFDLVIEKENDTYIGLIIDNQYKLSKTIVDTGLNKEAVIIPLRVEAISLLKYKALKIESRYESIKKDINLCLCNVLSFDVINNYIAENYDSIEELKSIYLQRYRENDISKSYNV